jgi:hypothetical protein
MAKDFYTPLVIGGIALGAFWLWQNSKPIGYAVQGVASGYAQTGEAIGQISTTTGGEVSKTLRNMSNVINTPLETLNYVEKGAQNLIKSVGSNMQTAYTNIINRFTTSPKTLKVNTPSDISYAKNIYAGVNPTVAAKNYYSGGQTLFSSAKTLKK